MQQASAKKHSQWVRTHGRKAPSARGPCREKVSKERTTMSCIAKNSHALPGTSPCAEVSCPYADGAPTRKVTRPRGADIPRDLRAPTRKVTPTECANAFREPRLRGFCGEAVLGPCFSTGSMRHPHPPSDCLSVATEMAGGMERIRRQPVLKHGPKTASPEAP